MTIELKTDFTQAVEVAKSQYKTDRLPKGEPLLSFKKRALVHFAVSGLEVWMTNKLAGAKTFFLPFNKGHEDGSAGNPPNQNSYLWDEVLKRDSILNILQRYMHLNIEEVSDPNNIYELQMKLEKNDIFIPQELENFSNAFFIRPKPLQAKMSSAIIDKMLKDEINKVYVINNEFGLARVAEENEGYGD